MSNHTVVISIFSDEASADEAVLSLKDSGVAKGDAIGVLVLDEEGKLKAEKAGKRSWGKGAGIGAVVALATPVGLAAGLLGGGLLGGLHHKNLGLSEEDRERISSDPSNNADCQDDQHRENRRPPRLTELRLSDLVI